MKNGMGFALNTVEVCNCNVGEGNAYYLVPLFLQLGFKKFDEMRLARAATTVDHATAILC